MDAGRQECLLVCPPVLEPASHSSGTRKSDFVLSPITDGQLVAEVCSRGPMKGARSNHMLVSG